MPAKKRKKRAESKDDVKRFRLEDEERLVRAALTREEGKLRITPGQLKTLRRAAA